MGSLTNEVAFISSIEITKAITNQEWTSLSSRKPVRECGTPKTKTEIASRISGILLVRLAAIVTSRGRKCEKKVFRAADVESDDFLASIMSEEVQLQLISYVLSILDEYNDVHFHNKRHAYHVVISANKLLDELLRPDKVKKRTFGIRSNPLYGLALIYAALIHDAGHQGVSNRQLVEEQNEVALLHNDQSVAEQHAISIAFRELVKPEYRNLYSTMFDCVEEYQFFRKLVIDIVLGTDIASTERTQIIKSKWKEAFEEHGAEKTKHQNGNMEIIKQSICEGAINVRDVTDSSSSSSDEESDVEKKDVLHVVKEENARKPTQYFYTRNHGSINMSLLTQDDMEVSDQFFDAKTTPESFTTSYLKVSKPSRNGSHLNSVEEEGNGEDEEVVQYPKTTKKRAEENEENNVAKDPRIDEWKTPSFIGCSSALNNELYETDDSQVNDSSNLEQTSLHTTSEDSDRISAASASRKMIVRPSLLTNRNRVSSANETVTSDVSFQFARSSITPAKKDLGSVHWRRLRLGVRVTIDLSGNVVQDSSENTIRKLTQQAKKRSLRDVAAGPISEEEGTDSRQDRCFDDDDDDEPYGFKATVVLETLLQAADISYMMQDWGQYKIWSKKLFFEEKAAFVSKRNKVNPEQGWFERQFLFINSYVIPLAHKLKTIGVFGENGDCFAQNAKDIRKMWGFEGKDFTRWLKVKWVKTKPGGRRIMMINPDSEESSKKAGGTDANMLGMLKCAIRPARTSIHSN